MTNRRVEAAAAMRFVLAVLLAAVLGVAVLGGAVWWLSGELGEPSPEELATATVDDYLGAWERSAWSSLASVTGGRDAGELAETHEEILGGLAVSEVALRRGEVVVADDLAEAGFTATFELEGLGEWAYDGVVELVRVDEEWLVDWSPATVHPSLEPDQRLAQALEWPEREAIVTHDSSVLSGRDDVVAVGFEPRRVEDADALADALAEHTGADADAVAAELERDDLVEDWFYPVAQLRPAEADQARDGLDGVEGVVFQETTARITPEEGFAQHVLGRTGEVTAELLEELGPPYAAGATVGRAGLERVFERRLAGEPEGEVRLVDGDGEVVEVLERFPGTEPEPVRTTLDIEVQSAAEAALDTADRPAALVAVDAGTGQLRAVASRPLGDFDRALGARYPPGSTFKVVTAAALLDGGIGPGDPVDCPAQATVGGRAFRNAGDRDLGGIDFAEAFAESCNTTFVTLAADLPGGALADAAAAFGFDTEPDLPLPAAAPRFPEPGDAVEHAAAAIGQGRVEASPAHMASVAAAVASGAWHPPVLILEDAEEDDAVADPGDDGDADTGDEADADEAEGDTGSGRPIGSAEVLGDLMRGVVTDGTGEAADVDGVAVAGKTGTAEVDDADDTHAWFIGYVDDLAFAVLVEEGGAGGDVAAPMVAAFVSALAGG